MSIENSRLMVRDAIIDSKIQVYDIGGKLINGSIIQHEAEEIKMDNILPYHIYIVNIQDGKNTINNKVFSK